MNFLFSVDSPPNPLMLINPIILKESALFKDSSPPPLIVYSPLVVQSLRPPPLSASLPQVAPLVNQILYYTGGPYQQSVSGLKSSDKYRILSALQGISNSFFNVSKQAPNMTVSCFHWIMKTRRIFLFVAIKSNRKKIDRTMRRLRGGGIPATIFV